MTKEQRAQLQAIAGALVSNPLLDEALDTALDMIQANWYDNFWKSNHNDPGVFENFLRDHASAQSTWPLRAEDITIVADKDRKVVMANVEKLCKILFGNEEHDLLDRITDLWSYYCLLPPPATKGHVVDAYICHIHPELDTFVATIETRR